MNVLFTDETVHGLIAEKFAYTKAGFIKDLSFEKSDGSETVPLPFFHHTPEESVYGFWSVIEYLDTKFGPDQRLIPCETPHEKAMAMAFCQYHLTKELLVPLHNNQGTGRIITALETITTHLGYRQFSFRNRLSLIDIFLTGVLDCLPAHISQPIPKLLVLHKEFIDDEIERYRQSTARYWDISDASEYRSEPPVAGPDKRPVTKGTLV